MMKHKMLVMACAGTLVPMGLALAVDEHVHRYVQASSGGGASREVRQRVKIPAPLLQRELAQMRKRLAILGQLEAALSRGAYVEAADLAEQNLGMSSLSKPPAKEVAKYMPHGMREMETELHRAASSFAVEAANAGSTGDARPAIAALSEVMQRCVGCHAAYRFR